jgi:hypothetical protein
MIHWNKRIRPVGWVSKSRFLMLADVCSTTSPPPHFSTSYKILSLIRSSFFSFFLSLGVGKLFIPVFFFSFINGVRVGVRFCDFVSSKKIVSSWNIPSLLPVGCYWRGAVGSLCPLVSGGASIYPKRQTRLGREHASAQNSPFAMV